MIEARFLNGDRVSAWIQNRKKIVARLIGSRTGRNARIDVGDGNGGSRNRGPARIGNEPCHLSSRQLSSHENAPVNQSYHRTRIRVNMTFLFTRTAGAWSTRSRIPWDVRGFRHVEMRSAQTAKSA